MIRINHLSPLLTIPSLTLFSAVLIGCGGDSNNAVDADPAPLFDEASDGEISDDPANPLSLQLTIGANQLNASVVAPDLDYVTINVPADTALTRITLDSYNSTNTQSFMALQPGTQFTEVAASANVANLLGYAHFGTVSVGMDILPDLAAGVGAQGFTTPLAAGDYTLWMQETGSAAVDFSITLEIESAQ